MTAQGRNQTGGDRPERAGSPIRTRFRTQVRDEVKAVGLRQLSTGGPQALSLNAIARDLGVSGPALYRYFASRDELLTDLIADAYRDLASALETAIAPARELSPMDRLQAWARAYRDWVNAEPHRYRLLFKAPLPGYDAQSRRLVIASAAAMDTLLDVLADLVPPAVIASPSALDDQLDRWAHSRGRTDISPALGRLAVGIWARLHGLLSLEIEGNFASMGLDPALLLDSELSALRRNDPRGSVDM